MNVRLVAVTLFLTAVFSGGVAATSVQPSSSVTSVCWEDQPCWNEVAR